MIFSNKPNKQKILIDGKKIWISRSIAVVSHVVTIGPDRSVNILLTERGPAAATENGKYCLPCGYLDWDESGAQAAMRETWEEAGLNLKNILENPTNKIIYNGLEKEKPPFYVHTEPNDQAQNVSLHYGLIFRRIERTLPKLSLEYNEVSGEVSRAFWMSWSDLINNIRDEKFAFNHRMRIFNFVNNFLGHNEDYAKLVR